MGGLTNVASERGLLKGRLNRGRGLIKFFEVKVLCLPYMYRKLLVDYMTNTDAGSTIAHCPLCTLS